MPASNASEYRQVADATELPSQEGLLPEGLCSEIVNNMPNGIAYGKMSYAHGDQGDFVYLYANTAFESQTGLGPVRGKRASEIMRGIRYSNAQLFESYSRVALGGPPESVAAFFEPIQQWISVQVFSPKPHYVVSILDVIPKRNRSEQGLLEKERLGVFATVAFDGIVVSEDGTIVDCNEQLARMLKLPVDLIKGRLIADFIAPDNHHQVMCNIVSDRESHLEHDLLCGDGSLLRVEVIGRPQKSFGRNLRFTVIRDISDRLRAAEELARLHAEMRQLLEWQIARHTAAALAHEVNQPLTSISALCEVGRLVLAEGDSASDAPCDKLGRLLQRMNTEAERAGSVVRNLMQSLRAPEVKVETIDLFLLLQECVRFAKANAAGDIQVMMSCAEDIPAVRVNKVHVEKVLTNLIRNATEAMYAANAPITPIRISADFADDGEMACITVRDEGPGIKGELLEEIFHPFVGTKPTGLGMGLSICRSLIELQGGKLWHDTANGTGATFRFTLPFSR